MRLSVGLLNMAQVSNKIMEIIRCPICFSANLVFSSSSVLCNSCSESFPVVHGIPVMLHDETARIQIAEKGKRIDPSKLSLNRYDKFFMVPNSPREYIERCQSLASLRETKKHERCIDLGCGTFRMAIELKKRFKQVIAVDLAIENLIWGKLKAEKKGLHIDAIVANVNCLPVKSHILDAAIGIAMFEHLTWYDRSRMIKEISRVCKQGSPVVLNTWNYFPRLFESIVGFQTAGGKEWKEFYLRGFYYKYDKFSEVRDFFVSQGIGDIDLSPQFTTAWFGPLFRFLRIRNETRCRIDMSLVVVPVLGHLLGQIFSISYTT